MFSVYQLICMMVKTCSAYGCTNRWKKNNSKEKIQFHRFPFRRKEILKKWIIACRRENWSPSVYSNLCSKHFTEDDYQLRPGAVKYLKNEAVPSVFNFPPLPSCMKIKKEPCHDIVKFSPVEGLIDSSTCNVVSAPFAETELRCRPSPVLLLPLLPVKVLRPIENSTYSELPSTSAEIALRCTPVKGVIESTTCNVIPSTSAEIELKCTPAEDIIESATCNVLPQTSMRFSPADGTIEPSTCNVVPSTSVKIKEAITVDVGVQSNISSRTNTLLRRKIDILQQRLKQSDIKLCITLGSLVRDNKRLRRKIKIVQQRLKRRDFKVKSLSKLLSDNKIEI